MNGNNIEHSFPNLKTTGYRITSPMTPEYNCYAWAAGFTDIRWDPFSYYWPDGIPRVNTKEAFIKAYESIGYMICASSAYEKGYEKIAIYTTPFGTPTHAARQLTTGIWTSKLGDYEDIEHNLLDGLVGQKYGLVSTIMKRQIK